MSTVQTSKLFRLRDDLDRESAVAAHCAGLRHNETYWLVVSRPSSIGGYLGNFEGTYEHALGVSPNGKTIGKNIPMRYLENFGLSTE